MKDDTERAADSLEPMLPVQSLAIHDTKLDDSRPNDKRRLVGIRWQHVYDFQNLSRLTSSILGEEIP